MDFALGVPMLTIALAALVMAAEPATASRYFAIRVVDEQTGRGVPLVELRTVHGVRLYTDSAGIAAFQEPGLMDRDVFFFVNSHGYEFAKDGFGFSGRALRPTPGGNATLRIKRINIAERIYRVTGAGIYRDSVLVGEKPPLKEPLLDGQVLGSDSVLNAVYRGKVYWFWGDTNRASYPLGNFHVPGAISQLPGRGGLEVERGVDLAYFVDDRGFAKATCQMPGKGPTWLTSLVTLSDGGRERLYGSFVKVEAPLKIYARGLAVFDDDKQEFQRLADVELSAPAFPMGHAFRHTEDGVEYIYFAHPYPLTRVRATPNALQRIADYECYTCLKSGSRLNDQQLENVRLDRDGAGRLLYAWKKDTPAVGPAEQSRLVGGGKMKPEEPLLRLRDRETGKPVTAHSGSVCWNEYRRRWVLITVQSGGSSYLGEVWCTEAEAPVGPWSWAVKVVTHDRYSFYNPKQHPMFDQQDGRIILFEGTYTQSFSGNPEATPRYEYNQVMYKLDLADPRLALPVAVYDISRSDVPEQFATMDNIRKDAAKRDNMKEPNFHSPPPSSRRVAFFAYDRAVPGSIPIMAGEHGLTAGKPDGAGVGAVFHALPTDAKSPPRAVAPLYEYVHDDGQRRAYGTKRDLRLPQYRRVERPLCLVWPKD